jgi:L-threonylcarbamoyladenylate synthase
MIENELNNALDVLRSGGIILYPTDTIWGIGCDATNKEAVQRIYDIKKRDDRKSMLILLSNINRLSSYLDQVPELAYDIIEMTNKPTTIIYSGAKNLAENLIADDGSIGIRITQEEFSAKLCDRFNKPVVSTSANISGDPFPVSFGDISKKIIKLVDYVVQYNQDSRSNKPSSVIKLGNNNEVKVIRE